MHPYYMAQITMIFFLFNYFESISQIWSSDMIM